METIFDEWKSIENASKTKRLESMAMRLGHPVHGVAYVSNSVGIRYATLYVGVVIRNVNAAESVAGPVTVARHTYDD